jgi:hypothetical protein
VTFIKGYALLVPGKAQLSFSPWFEVFSPLCLFKKAKNKKNGLAQYEYS